MPTASERQQQQPAETTFPFKWRKEKKGMSGGGMLADREESAQPTEKQAEKKKEKKERGRRRLHTHYNVLGEPAYFMNEYTNDENNRHD